MNQCKIGFYGAYMSIFVNRSLNYLILLYRIKIVFQDSMYEYSPTTIQILIAAITLYCIANIILLFWVEPPHWTMNTNETQSIVYCSRDDEFHPILLSQTFFSAVMDQIFNMIFLYMFISKLILLRKELIKQYLFDHSLKYLEKLESLSKSSSKSTKNEVKEIDFVHVPSKIRTAAQNQVNNHHHQLIKDLY